MAESTFERLLHVTAAAGQSTGPRASWWFSVLKLAVLPIAVMIIAVFGLYDGTVSIPLSHKIDIVLNHLGVPMSHHYPQYEDVIIWTTRLPRVVTALVVGAALSISGAIFQAVLRNPLADPFVIGTSSGAAFGVVVALVAGWSFAFMGFGAVQVAAFLGAMLAIGIVLLLSYAGRRGSIVSVLLAGFAVSTLMIAAMWLVAFEGGSAGQLLNWTMGSLAGGSWQKVNLIGPLILALAVVSLYFVRDLNALLLGEEHAANLGLNAERVRFVLLVLGSLMTALAVSIAGIIGFVGLVVPHIARLIYGPNHRTLLLTTALIGAGYLCLADLGARTLASNGGEIPLGILTAVIGAPVLLILLKRSGDVYRF